MEGDAVLGEGFQAPVTGDVGVEGGDGIFTFLGGTGGYCEVYGLGGWSGFEEFVEEPAADGEADSTGQVNWMLRGLQALQTHVFAPVTKTYVQSSAIAGTVGRSSLNPCTEYGL